MTVKRYAVQVRIGQKTPGGGWWATLFTTEERGAAIARAYTEMDAQRIARAIDRHTGETIT